MAINQNHLFEDLDSIKCAVVEKNVSAARVEFLKKLLEYNGYTIVAVPSAPPKSAPAPSGDNGVADQSEEVVSTFTLGVTDVTFNSTNAIFGRLLRTPEGRVVTNAYWNQEEKISDDTVPYFEKRNK